MNNDLIERLRKHHLCIGPKCENRELIKEAITALREMEEALDNEQAKGIHSCGPHCKRPLCVANKRIAEQEKELMDLRRDIAKQDEIIEQYGNAHH